MVIKPGELPFEKALERLEEIVDRLEDGSVPLEEAVNLFEEGIGLRKRCLQLLKKAEQRIKFLTDNAEGAPVETEPPAGWEDESEGDEDVG
jgi:exodeoxyribonuclease VII small subunit